MRTLFGAGTPRGLQGRIEALLAILWALIRLPETLWTSIVGVFQPSTAVNGFHARGELCRLPFTIGYPFATDC
jgi:hypothetical protein